MVGSGNKPVKGSDEYEMESRWRIRVQTHFKGFVVVWVDAKTRNKTIDHQINVLIHISLPSRERFSRIKQQYLKITICESNMSINYTFHFLA